jgi:hypothetical protein
MARIASQLCCGFGWEEIVQFFRDQVDSQLSDSVTDTVYC